MITFAASAFTFGLCCAMVGVVYATVIASERSPLDPWFDLLRWMDDRTGWLTPLSWIAKPLGACSKCFSGWLAMFASSSLVPWSPDAMSIGDSLTRGSTLFSPIVSMALTNGDSTWQRWARLYPALRNNLIINKGIGGNTTAMVAARIQADVLDNHPKLVMLSVCNNDYSAPITIAARTTNIQNSLNLCATAGVPAVIYNATYGTPDEARQPDHRLFYLEWWNDYRPTLTGVQGAVNIMGGLREPGGYADNLLTQTDGIHPNVTGYGRMGRWIEALPYA